LFVGFKVSLLLLGSLQLQNKLLPPNVGITTQLS